MTPEAKSTLRWVLIGVAFLAALVLVFFAGRSYQKQQPSESEKYLKEQIEYYQQEAAKWQENYEKVAADRETLEQSVIILENRVESIKKYYAKKISAIKSYSNPELEQFFADRYRE